MHPSCPVIEENHILGWRRIGIGLDCANPGSVLIRHNLIQADTNGIGVCPLWQNSGFPLYRD